MPPQDTQDTRHNTQHTTHNTSPMNLNAYVAEKRTQIFENLQNGQRPGEGEFLEELLKEGRAKGQPQMGTTRFEPKAIVLEFIYPDPRSSATVLAVRIL